MQQSKGRQRRPYEPPVLQCFGDIRALTLAPKAVNSNPDPGLGGIPFGGPSA